MERFGGKLRTLRKRHSLTLRELAPELDLASYSHLAKIERGTIQPTAKLILKIAKFFNVTADPLMNDELELD